MYSTQTAYQPVEKIMQMQEAKLHGLLAYLNQHSPFYKELFSRHHISISEIKT